MRRRLFVEAFISNGGNKTQAALDAGFSPTSAERQSSRIYNEPWVQTEIVRRRKELMDESGLNTDTVLRELGRVCFMDIGKCFDEAGKLKPLHDIDVDTRRALASFKDGEIRAFSKPEALRAAMQHLGLIQRGSINVNAQAASVAAAEVKTVDPGQRSMLEIARRIAFTLSMGTPPQS